MQNLEIKVKVVNFDSIKDRLGFSKYEKTLEQTDTYFLVGKIQLKIRETETNAEIISYIRKIENGTMESAYYRINIFGNSLNFIKSIFSFIFVTKVIVIKKRDLYVYKNTRIHLDTVENLGKFIELETVCQKDKNNMMDLIKYRREHEEIKKNFHFF